MKDVVRVGISAIMLMLVGVGGAFAVGGGAPDAVVILKAQGVTCGSCAGKIEKALKEKGGVAAVEVDIDKGRVTAAYDSAAVKPEVLAETVSALGYGSKIVKTMPLAEYRAAEGDAEQKGSGGCGGGCCNKKRKAE